MKQLVGIIIFFVLSIISSGCSKQTSSLREDNFRSQYQHDLLKVLQPKMVTNSEDNAYSERKLAESASEVSQSLQELAKIERAVHPMQKFPAESDAVTIALSGLASIDYTGPIEPLLEKIASTSHNRLRKLGHTPATPIIISLTKHDVPLADIFRDVQYQAQNHVNIQLLAKEHIIEIRYLHG